MPDVWVFLDESGTHAAAERLLVGAVVAADREALEAAVVDAVADIAAQPLYWDPADDIEAFRRRGFHFSQDNASVRGEFLSRLTTMNVRIHVAYSASGKGDAWRSRAAAMYYQLARGVLARYRHCAIHFVFERENGMNRFYSGIVELAAGSVVGVGDQDSWSELSWDVSTAGKDDPALAVADYALAALTRRVSFMREGGFEARYAQAFTGHVAYLLDYDKALRYSSRASSLPLTGAGGHDGRARVALGSQRSQQFPMTPRSPSPTPSADAGLDDAGEPPDIPVAALVTETPVLAPSSIGVRQLPGFLGYSPGAIASLLGRIEAGGCYKEVEISVKGRPRLVEIPDDGLAAVQRRIFSYLSRLEFDLPGCVHGYVRGRSNISNATAHAGMHYLQKFDLQDFFPSITREAVARVLAETGFTPGATDQLGRILTYRGRLPLGACTSPMLSNLCLRELDAKLQALALNDDLVYTRYSDDLTFSGAQPFDVRPDIGAAVAAAGFRLNDAKTVTARYGQALYVTGLSVSDQMGPRLPKQFKRKLRQQMYLLQKFGLDGDLEFPEAFRSGTEPFLQGRLRYARAVEPAFVEQLALKFPQAYAVVTHESGEPHDIEQHERSLMDQLDRLRRTPQPYRGTRHYSTEF